MGSSAIISFLGENKPNLISEITSYLTDKGGEFSGVTFATLGRVCELTMVYHKLEKIEINEIKSELEKLESARNGDFQVKPLEAFSDGGPTTKITHRVVLSGEDQKGLLNKIIKTLNDNNALIIRMNTEKITFSEKTQYICRFAISIRDENAPHCLSQMVKVAGEMKLTFRYETS